MNIKHFPLSPADQVRCLRALVAKLPEQEAQALLQVAGWMATERTSDDPVTKEMIVGWVRDIIAEQEERAYDRCKVLQFPRTAHRLPASTKDLL